jgi:membrane protease YdiL (CAAX protease family)
LKKKFSLGFRLFFLESAAGVVILALAYLWIPFSKSLVWTLQFEQILHLFLWLIPILGFGWVATSKWAEGFGPLRRIDHLLRNSALDEYLKMASLPNLLLLSLSAGFFEELVFRGALQLATGIVVASLVFGVVHAITFTYFIIATLLGFYLGIMYKIEGVILIPIAVHTLYDFLVLWRYRISLRDENPNQLTGNL